MLLALRMKYPPNLSSAERAQLSERMRRVGPSLVFGYWVLLIGGMIDLVAAAATKKPGYFVLGVLLVAAAYAMFRHYRALRDAVGPRRR